jgi:hypothetical protein
MIWMIHLCIFEKITDTNMKEPQNNIETHEVYIVMFDMCSIRYSASVNGIVEFLPCTSQL